MFFCHNFVLFLLFFCNKILLNFCFACVVFLFLFVLFHNLDLNIGLPLFLFWFKKSCRFDCFCAHDKCNLGLSCILSMLKSINVLMKFAHIIDVFVDDYVITIKSTKQIFKMYNDSYTLFNPKNFCHFMNMVTNTFHIITQN